MQKLLGKIGKVLFHRLGIVGVLIIAQIVLYVAGLVVLRDSAYFDRVEWLFLAISTILGFGYRQIIKKQTEESAKSMALQEGVQALLRDRIIWSYNHYQDRGYCPIYAKENIKRMYDAYHGLGGNDVATNLKDKLIDMSETEPAEREEEDEY